MQSNVRRLREEKGQTASDYMGMLVILAAVIGAIAATGIAGDISSSIRRAICVIAGQGGCDFQTASTHEPKGPCLLAAANQKVSLNGNVDVRFVNVKLEGGVEYLRQKRSDGTVAVTLKLGTSGSVGPKIKDMLGDALSADARVKGAQEGGVTFILPSDEAANHFADQLEETTKAIAAGPVVSHFAGWDIDIDFPPVESAYYQTGPGASVSLDADAEVAYGSGEIDVQHAAGIRHNFTKGKPDSGDTTIYYNVAGSGSGTVGAMIGLNAGGKLEGSWQVAVTIGSNGEPKKLSLIGAGGYQTTEGLGGKFKDLESAIRGVSAVNVEGNEGDGERIEVQADLDLTDPQLRDTAMSLLRGPDPSSPNPVSRTDAAAALWDEMVENSTVNYRTYDTSSSKVSAGLDLPGAGGEVAYENKDQELTGAYYLEPGQGFVPWEACKKS